MSESTQIVRRLQRGEFIPAGSWDGLLVSPRIIDKQPVCERNHDLIRLMVADRKSSAEIADLIGCSVVWLNQYIGKIPELKAARLKFKSQRKTVETSAWDRYQEKRHWVKKALKTRSLDAVAKKLGFSFRTLQWYLAKDEIEELRAEVKRLKEVENGK
ncbi:hypothetical protein SAMN05216428_102317 [Nitrosospira sp. Nsp11]|uniref:hypothetical protein n=1 Tax=Nitrosospira sp. Nsp11 TaxID=1855338 RepID=UPI00092013E9|nr:hypothetical protein [Nitrosospira sp. Nsp11]SHL41110.1 hypothetical protein SAMN05216428_102317 [Nitrosospira sp. Nsp11]